MNVLIVSNGHGEAAIAGYLGRALLARAPGTRVEHFPLVGGSEGASAVPSIVGPQSRMPSGGLVAYWNLRNLTRDIGAGLFGLMLRQFAFLRRQRERDAIVAVGDVYCLAASLLFGRRPTVFVATAKSQHVAGHSRLESAIARRARVVFARDAATAQALAARGVNARYAGNLMMDGVAADADPRGSRAQFEDTLNPAALHVGVLPGSREDAQTNAAAAIRRLLLIADALAPRALQALVSVAPGIMHQSIAAACEQAGVALESSANGGCVVARGARGSLEVLALDGCFGDLLRASDIVLGQAGTGNEQAAGLGKPVVASAQDGKPGKLGWYRMRQQRLLGDALLVLPDDDREFAQGVVALLGDTGRMQAMSREGRARMGEPGGSQAVAEAVLALASE
jgi:tetraacyldisaccharide 4'-kinase